MNILLKWESGRQSYTIDKSYMSKSMRYPDDLLKRCDEFYAVKWVTKVIWNW